MLGKSFVAGTAVALAIGAGAAASCGQVAPTAVAGYESAARCDSQDAVVAQATKLIEEGRRTFRFDTFGDEAFWGGSLKLHQVIRGADNGGVGLGLAPVTALNIGLKVDADALPQGMQEKLKQDRSEFQDPKVTLELLSLNALVGLTGFFDEKGALTSVGVQCALCHSTVDDSVAPGIGKRRDGWPNRDLNVGTLISLSPDLSTLAALLQVEEDVVREALLSWGPGKFDAALLLDGKALRPDGKPAATLIPPTFGLAGVGLQSWTGWGSVAHWTALFANLELHGQGTFYDPRLDDVDKFPVAARNGFSSVRNLPDRVTPKLVPLHVYLSALTPPAPSPGTFDAQAAERGREVFEDKALCATCHVPPLFTEPGWAMHFAQEIGIDDFQSMRSPDERYRTAPLRGLFAHGKGGYYHDGRFTTLDEVVVHYDRHFGLELADHEKKDLVEYLKSL